jgi:hypothetical protein
MPETATSPIYARLLQRWECLPAKFQEPLTSSQSLDVDWVWVAVYREEIVGLLAACACHGAALVVRILMDENAPITALLVLLRQFFRDSRNRSLNGFVVLVDNKNPVEQRIGEIMRKSFQGTVSSPSFTLISAAFPKEA